jgi:hypothetical protein
MVTCEEIQAKQVQAKWEIHWLTELWGAMSKDLKTLSRLFSHLLFCVAVPSFHSVWDQLPPQCRKHIAILKRYWQLLISRKTDLCFKFQIPSKKTWWQILSQYLTWSRKLRAEGWLL